MKFEKVMRKKVKLWLVFIGLSGLGKIYSVLLVVKGIGGKIVFIDIEKGSVLFYFDVVEFDVLEFDLLFLLEWFIEVIKFVEDVGYDFLVIDSIMYEWGGVGGCFELVDIIVKVKYCGNSWLVWSEINL